MDMIEFASGLAKRHLTDARVEALRTAYMSGRNRLAPVLRLWRGSFGVDELRRDLEQHVGPQFEVLMVHSSFNAMKPMFSGSAIDLLRMLIEWVGPERTLAMPAFWFGDQGRGAHASLVANPRFDLQRTPSQMGLLTELFRRWPGVVQSRHPVYRIAALGPMAAALTAGHEHADTPAGRGTPFEFMAKHDTAIVGIGKPVQVMTQAHHTEHSMGDEFPVPSTVGTPLPITLVERGREIPFELRSRSVAGRYDIWRIHGLLAPGTLDEWKFHGVPMFATRAGEVTRQLVDAARAGRTLYVAAR